MNKLKNFLNRKKLQQDIELHQKQMIYDHLIAIARLHMIKPSTLYKESRNVQANAEYLMRMAEEMKGGK